MGRLRVALVFAFVLVPLSASAQTVDRNVFMSDIVGKSWKWRQDGYSGTVRYYPNGAVRITTSIEGIPEDRGAWEFRGNRLCTRYNKIRNGRVSCGTMTETGRNAYRNSNGGEIFR